MKKFVFLAQVLLLSTSVSMFAVNVQPNDHQVVKPKLSSDIKLLFESEQYQKIVDWYAEKAQTLSSENLTYIAQAYMHLEDLENANKYADMVIAKSPQYAKAYYIKGIMCTMNNDDETALFYFKKASIQDPQESTYYAAIGDIYFAEENYEEALSNFNKAAELPQYSEKAYYMIGATYASQNKDREALDAFYIAKSKVVEDKELYVTVLYNIGATEFGVNNYKKAITAYKELLDYIPDDYYSFEKLVQCYYALGQYGNGDIYKKRLYGAAKKGNLISTSISDMFCFDQFSIGARQISAYERYEEPEEGGNNTFVKNVFYAINDKGDIDSSFLLEYSSEKVGEVVGTYRLFMIKGGFRYTFDRVFDLNVGYATLKSYLADIVEGKVKPIE